MRHLIVSREFPPATYPAGGIGTYVANIARLLAEAGETVHVIGEKWSGAPQDREVLCNGGLIVHRISRDDVPQYGDPTPPGRLRRELAGLQRTAFPQQWFAWSAAFLIERLVEAEGIDVIEGQEWEAPLYYVLLRRSIGLGPARRPPCVVHLHSPSDFIHHYNGSPVPPAALPTMRRMEEFCIKAADALLCPSRSLADAAGRRYEIARERITTIPLPVGFTPLIARDAKTWAEGSICFVGRLEPRKGIIEWVEAATGLAKRHPALSFNFVGADNWRLQSSLVRRIGRDLAPRFRFHGAKSREEIAGYLAQANAAAVPSRWENFPNVCIEAMSSGLPVIASRSGGMVELIEDGRSGWLAEDWGVAGLADSLAAALGRYVATSPERKAVMGEEAAKAARTICDNASILAAHQRFRTRVADGAVFASPARTSAQAALAAANVAIQAPSWEEAQPLLQSIARQTTLPRRAVLVCRQRAPAEQVAQVRSSLGFELIVHDDQPLVGTSAWNKAVELLRHGPAPGLWMFLDEADRLEPDCVARMSMALASGPTIAIVSPWTGRLGRGGGIDARPSADLAHQLIANDVAPASAFRAAAIGAEPPFPAGFPRGYDVWTLANRLIAAGWQATTLPMLAAHRAILPATTDWVQDTALRAIRSEALAPFSNQANRLAVNLVEQQVPITKRTAWRFGGQALEARRLLLRGIESVLFDPASIVRNGRSYLVSRRERP